MERGAAASAAADLRVHVYRWDSEPGHVESGDSDVGNADVGRRHHDGSEGVVFGAYGEYSATTTTNERIGAAVADQVVRSRYASMWSKKVTSPFTGAATASGNSSTWIGSVIAFTRTDVAGLVITPPTVSLTTPVSGATFTAPASVVMTATGR